MILQLVFLFRATLPRSGLEVVEAAPSVSGPVCWAGVAQRQPFQLVKHLWAYLIALCEIRETRRT